MSTRLSTIEQHCRKLAYPFCGALHPYILRDTSFHFRTIEFLMRSLQGTYGLTSAGIIFETLTDNESEDHCRIRLVFGHIQVCD